MNALFCSFSQRYQIPVLNGSRVPVLNGSNSGNQKDPGSGTSRGIGLRYSLRGDKMGEDWCLVLCLVCIYLFEHLFIKSFVDIFTFFYDRHEVNVLCRM
jgi:hypothetical protein